MASFSKRTKKNGDIVHTAQIRISRGGKKYTEAKTHRDKKVLEQWAARREAELSEPGSIEREQHKGTTIGDVLKWYLEDFQGRSKFGRSKLSHIDYLLNDYEFASLDAIKLTPMQLIKHARSRNAGPSTINNDFVWLRNAMRAVRLTRDMPLDLTVIDDAVGLLRSERVISASKRRDRRPTLEELNKLLEYFDSRDGRAQIKMVDVVLFAMFSSRRQEEICLLRWEDLDKRRKGILVRDMKHPTNKSDTFVYLTDEALAVIDRQDREGELIFPFNSKSISAAFTRACSFLEIKDLRFHDLRRECVSWLFERGYDIPRVSNISGHKSWSSLQIYVHLREHEPHDKYKGWEWRPS